MPDYRTGVAARGTRPFSAVAGFMNLKRQFEHAKMQNEWKMQQDYLNNQSEERRTRIGAGANLASTGVISPKQYGDFIDQGQLPESSRAAGIANGGQISPEEQMSDAGIPLEQQQDYRVTPQTYMYRGRQQTIGKLERKKDVSLSVSQNLAGMKNTAITMSKNVNDLLNKDFKIGPGVTTLNNMAGDIAAQYLRGPEFTTWKSEVGKVFQEYRKYVTGVQAGFPEIQFLAVSFPKATDTRESFIRKSQEAVKTINRNVQNSIDTMNKAGYATSAFGQGGQPSKGKTSSGNTFERIE